MSIALLMGRSIALGLDDEFASIDLPSSTSNPNCTPDPIIVFRMVPCLGRGNWYERELLIARHGPQQSVPPSPGLIDGLSLVVISRLVAVSNLDLEVQNKVVGRTVVEALLRRVLVEVKALITSSEPVMIANVAVINAVKIPAQSVQQYPRSDALAWPPLFRSDAAR